MKDVSIQMQKHILKHLKNLKKAIETITKLYEAIRKDMH